ncbi:MAG: class I SAM-dependent methyltransferase [Minisyncoccia bacterium]
MIRRTTFDRPVSYYEALNPADIPEKRAARFRNSKNRIRLFSRFVPLSAWCDIGTGEGIFLEALKLCGGSGVGIEPSEECRKKAIRHGVTIVGHTIEDITVVTEYEPVRVVSLFHVIEHLEHPEVELKRVYDALPSCGFLIVETPNIDSPVYRLRRYKDPLIYPEHLWYFSETTVRALLEKVGFRVVASGKRDFDQYNLPIRESLFRLGFSKRNPSEALTKRGTVAAGVHVHEKASADDTWLRVLVRRGLSLLVVLAGRLQYTWVVAQK